MASPFTCRNCNILLWDLEVLRQHYKSEWHKYNLKRKIVNQPPITAEEFEALNAVKCKKYEESKENRYCNTCRKKFNTKNQYENHLVSKKHKENFNKHESNDSELSQRTENAAETVSGDTSGLGSSIAVENPVSSKRTDMDDTETDSVVESVDSDGWIEDTENPMDNNDCLFCDHHSRSLTRNLKHMTVAHTFFIPDPEYCVNIRGLLTYLGEKIFAGYMCIWCNDSGKAFKSADGARTHMLDKGHCKMLHEGEALLEYSDFYDYSSSYPDAGNVEDPDVEVALPAELDDTDYQMKLPSGNVIGHRALMRYYKQKLNPNSTVHLSVSHKMRQVLLQYRALGWTNTKKQEAVRKARDIKYMQRLQARYATQLQFKANKLQRYFRKQTMF
ncbi:PREDICTED: zinc finger protein 622 [Dinoponera quadriceps]|uniref:Zinc finger protein 622 n=1 Tax=Dinoponera quadriceps TaxID=609295 RepID=A0A6P3XUN7_DINQU|nr:PREDICTED: zinc finger protein 622 [Dinoponera quadriceps]XP_014482242.1 PREDICTED: zinc finger protein 622 [Dinoponera quadriceps]XP_014482243.1 PREDICTED: zinc finger protein 622 [Dinoponera quadriceps]